MFKIQRVREEAGVVFKLSGRIEKDDVDELRQLFESGEGSRDLVFDLEEVKLVDRDVVRFLGSCEERGVHLRNCPAYIRHWIAQEDKGKS